MDRLTSRTHRARAGRRPARVGITLLVTGAVLAAPAVARAAAISVQGTCFASGQKVAITGTAFSPGGPVALGGAVTGAAQATPAGDFTATVVAPTITDLGPQVVPVIAADQLNPANVASLQLNVVRQAFGSNLPVAGRPHAMTTWRFAGFAAGAPIYAHFLLGGRSRGDYRFGVAQGDCGTLTARAPRIPGVRALVPGHWTLRLDQRMTYHEDTPGSEVRFRILRRRGS